MAMTLGRLRCVNILRGFRAQPSGLSQCRQFSSENDGGKKDKPHPETPQFPDEFTANPPKGKIFDKKPFKLALKAEKGYHWCTCGTSKNQPLCDGSHKQLWGTSEVKKGYKWVPLRFEVEKEKEYWLCNCKQTNKAPFCDGTHKQQYIQDAVK